MWIYFAVASAIIFGIGSFIFKLSADRQYYNADILFGLYLSGSLTLLILSWPSQIEMFSPIALVLGVVIAVGSSLGNSLYLRVLQTGPASLSAPLVNCSNLLVVIISIAFFKEQLTLYKTSAVILFFISLAFLAFDPNESLAIRNKRWYLLVCIVILCNFMREGGLKIAKEFGLNTILILFYAYLYALLFNGFLIYQRKKFYSTTKFAVAWGIVVGLFSAGGLALYAKALLTGPASIIAPIFAARSFVVIILSMLLCKERLSFYQLIAVLLLIIAICILYTA